MIWVVYQVTWPSFWAAAIRAGSAGADAGAKLPADAASARRRSRKGIECAAPAGTLAIKLLANAAANTASRTAFRSSMRARREIAAGNLDKHAGHIPRISHSTRSNPRAGRKRRDAPGSDHRFRNGCARPARRYRCRRPRAATASSISTVIPRNIRRSRTPITSRPERDLRAHARRAQDDGLLARRHRASDAI